MKTIAILTGGDSAESVISLQSAKVVMNHLDSKKFRSILVHIHGNDWKATYQQKQYDIDITDFSILTENEGKIKSDLAFMALHGPPAENGELQVKLDKIGIPYTCCGAQQSALTFDKHRCNEAVKNLGFLCAKSYFYTKGEAINEAVIIQQVGLPCFVKPNAAGSSFGVSKVKNAQDLTPSIQKALEHGTQVLIEQCIDGTEVSCGIFTNQHVEVLPITEIVSKNEFFDYDAKYNGLSEEITPARISKESTLKIQQITKEIYQKLQLKGMVRIDFILHQKDPYLIEINTIPGLSEESIIPKQAKEAGYSLAELFEIAIENALK